MDYTYARTVYVLDDNGKLAPQSRAHPLRCMADGVIQGPLSGGNTRQGSSIKIIDEAKLKDPVHQDSLAAESVGEKYISEGLSLQSSGVGLCC